MIETVFDNVRSLSERVFSRSSVIPFCGVDRIVVPLEGSLTFVDVFCCVFSTFTSVAGLSFALSLLVADISVTGGFICTTSIWAIFRPF